MMEWRADVVLGVFHGCNLAWFHSVFSCVISLIMIVACACYWFSRLSVICTPLFCTLC